MSGMGEGSGRIAGYMSSILDRLRASSLKVKVSLGVIVPLVLLSGLFIYAEYQYLRSIMLSNLSQLASNAGQVIEDNLRQQMLKTDFESMQNMLDSIGRNQDFRVVYLLDTSGEVIFAPGKIGVGLQLNNQQPDCIPCHILPGPARASSIVVTLPDGSRLFRSMNPIENSSECVQCHDAQQRNIGLLLIDIKTASLEASLNRDLRKALLWWIGAIFVILLVINLVLQRFVFRRLGAFSTAIRSLGEGKPSPVVDAGPRDELGRLALGFNDMVGQIEQRNAENEALASAVRQQNVQRGELLKRLIGAQEDERKRVARELHDEVGQSLSGLALHLEAIQRWLESDPDRAREQLEQVKAQVADTSNQMYELILALRPSALDDLGLPTALRMYADRVLDGKGVAIHFDASRLTPRLPAEIETCVYRVFQEALNNVARHSAASNVTIALSRTAQEFVGVIQDDGSGFDPDLVHTDERGIRGLGLLGMQERTSLFSGTLDIQSGEGGTFLTLRIPLDV